MQLEYQLRTEIEFWRDVIETCPSETAEASRERMVMARTLAERKLQLLLEDGSPKLN